MQALFMAFAIGKIIKDLVKQNGLKAKNVAQYINVSESTLYGIYNRQSVDIDKLILFSRLFNKNLFLYYLNEEPLKSMFSKDIVVFQNQIAELEKELLSKNGKIEDLLEIIANQKKLISFHEQSQVKTKNKSNK
ncbi:XRE family transcriptional regulator [Pedobacter frigidisoli]|uniref:XRE family transcriptional regulator n=1 Tax=Pedobacter frigidisoli TaxID=2530455 RepID=A0A4R0NZ82_9SPHI|nr:helix-turn-helix transcriptional regulator [Pedobacter frigidisoli]TCD05853.1 XRE family transcriptional regulator [Pedobacter frigidisoli]